jgi:putative sigma-54 modulation protein
MNIQITARHFHASQELQDSVTEQVQGLTKFYNNITDAIVVLDQVGEQKRKVELKLNILDKSLSAHAEEDHMGKAIDAVMNKIQRQLKKENGKLKEHRSTPVADLVSE